MARATIVVASVLIVAAAGFGALAWFRRVPPPDPVEADEMPKAATSESGWVVQSEDDFRNTKPSQERYLSNGVTRKSGLWLDGSAFGEQFLRLGERTPHAVRWEVTFQVKSKKRVVRYCEDGFFLGSVMESPLPPLREGSQHTIVIQRERDQLDFFCDGIHAANFPVDSDDTSQLRILSFAAGGGPSTLAVLSSKISTRTEIAGPKPAADKAPRWVEAFRDDFSDASSLKNYLNVGGKLEWMEEKRGMLLRNLGWGQQMFVAVHGSYPGDLRVRFRALRAKSAQQVNIGLLVALRGGLPLMTLEEGYFVEWELGTAVVKKRMHEEKRAKAPTPATADRWVQLEFQRVGTSVQMSMEGTQVLQWTDAHPMVGREYDLFGFYVYNDSTVISDLVIERNANDKIEPRKDDPASMSVRRTLWDK